MLKLQDKPLADAGYSMILGIHNENDGAKLQNRIIIINVATNPAPTETIGIGSKTYTFIASGATGDQINIGLSATATAANIMAKINLDYEDAGCSAFELSVPGAMFALVSNTTGTPPVFTPDGVKIVIDTAWAGTIAESMLEDEDYFKIPLTDVNAKPIVLVERNAGTYQNFLY